MKVCKNCEKRSLGCHNYCAEYLVDVAEEHAKTEYLRKKSQAYKSVDEAHAERVKRAIRKKRR